MSNQDQNFFDVFMLIIGLLVGVTFGIFLLARYVAGNTQDVYTRSDAAYQEQALARIEPVGRVALPGDAESADTGSGAALPEAAPVAEKMSGPQVYNAACLACHGAGIGGAPKIGDKAAWSPRIAQGKDVLSGHALNGFQGQAGYMPPKGGRVDLSDEEILGAMTYMIGESS